MIILGTDRDGSSITCEKELLSGVLIKGLTKTGKSVLANHIINQLSDTSTIRIELPKSCNDKILESKLGELIEELNARKELLTKNNCLDIEEYNKKFRNKQLPLIIVNSEFSPLLSPEGLKNLNTLLASRRGNGFVFILETQAPLSSIPAEVRVNMDYLVSFKSNRVENSQLPLLDRLASNEYLVNNLKNDSHIISQSLSRIFSETCLCEVCK